MSTRIVTTQADLDAAVASGETPEIKSGGRFDISNCTLIYVSGSSQPRVVAWGAS